MIIVFICTGFEADNKYLLQSFVFGKSPINWAYWVNTGVDFKAAHKKLWKLKEKVVGPKVGPAEPSCINDPNTGELITNKEQIKSTSLAHCVKILTKKTIRECDKEELKRKEENHEKIMNKKDSGEYILDRKLYKAVMKDIKKKNKGSLNS